MQYRILIALIAPFVLSGCLAQSNIQSKYMDSQEGCRNETARSVGGGETARPVSETQTSPIAQRFSQCMTKEGWHLSTPKPTAVAVNNPPTGSPSTNPSAALKAPGREVPAQNYPPASSYPAASSYPPNTNYPYAAAYPPSGSPSVNPSAAASVAPAPVQQAAPVQQVAPVARSAAPASAPAATNAPVAQTEIPTSPDVATYQPGRPTGQATPYYGTGPGRQF